MKAITGILIFAAGAVVGALGMRHYLLRQLEEVEVENYVPREERQDVEEPVDPVKSVTDDYEDQKTKSIIEYAAKLVGNGYTDYAAISGNSEQKKTEETAMKDHEQVFDIVGGQRIITEEEYGQKDGYDTYSYVYYAGNSVLVDDAEDQMLEDEIIRTVGWNALALFDNPAIWAVYVRNDKLKADYEITLDKRAFADEPPQTEVDSDEDGD